jgi:hypothetical protein
MGLGRRTSSARTQCPGCGRHFNSLAHHLRSCLSTQGSPRLPTDDVGNSELAEHQKRLLRARAAELLQHLRYDKLVAANIIDELKPELRRTRRLEIEALRQQLLPLVKPGAEEQLDAVLSSIEDPVYGLGTKKQEHAYAVNVQKLPVLKPRVRNLRQPGAIASKDVKNHGSVGVSIIESLSRLLQNDAETCKLIVAASREWKSGALHGRPADSFSDITDGINFRQHEITREAEPDLGDIETVRVGIGMYNDGVTVCLVNQTH